MDQIARGFEQAAAVGSLQMHCGIVASIDCARERAAIDNRAGILAGAVAAIRSRSQHDELAMAGDLLRCRQREVLAASASTRPRRQAHDSLSAPQLKLRTTGSEFMTDRQRRRYGIA